MRHRGLLFGLLMLLTAGSTSAAMAQDGAKTPGPNGIAANPPDYRIGSEDTLKISVWKNEELSPTVQVRPDGKISLPLLHDIQAAGLTPDELRDIIAKGLVNYVNNPEVAVIVTEVKSFKVSILGEVGRPGRYDLKSHHTVLDVIALAGGLTPFAARSRIVVLRPEGSTMRRVPFNYAKVLANSGSLLDRLVNLAADEQENFYVQGGDVILVP